MADFTCASHSALAVARGGIEEIGELTPLTYVRYERIRDDISTAEVRLPAGECCEMLGNLRTILNELHIYRDGEPVWEGPITRLEYDFDEVRIYAEDVLWQAKRTVLQRGYDQSYPNIGFAIDRADWLLRNQCYQLHGDPWNVVPHLHKLTEGGPRTARVVAAYEMYVWQDFDKYAEDYGLDYTVVNRDIYYWDHGTEWMTLPDLDERFLSEFPRIVEYGNQLFTRGFVSNARGYAGMATVPVWSNQEWYGLVDQLTTNIDDVGDQGEDVAEARQTLEEALAQVTFILGELADARAAEADAKEDAERARAVADLREQQAECAEQTAQSFQQWANNVQNWADTLQRQADETGDPDLAATAQAEEAEARGAEAKAEESRERADCLAEVANAWQDLADITGDPAHQNAADAAKAAAQDADDQADLDENEANTQRNQANAARAAASATNDPALQAAANAAKADAVAAQNSADARRAAADAAKEVADNAEDNAREQESEYAAARSTVKSWEANLRQARKDVEDARDDLAEEEDKLAEAIEVWADTARRNLRGHFPAPAGIVIPANTSLLPGSPWDIQDLVPGAMFTMTLTRLCRTLSSKQMINVVRVEESAPDGEKVQISTTSVYEVEVPI